MKITPIKMMLAMVNQLYNYTDEGLERAQLSVAFQVFCPVSFRLVAVPTGTPPLLAFVMMMSALAMSGGVVMLVSMSVGPAASIVVFAVISAVLYRDAILLRRRRLGITIPPTGGHTDGTDNLTLPRESR